MNARWQMRLFASLIGGATLIGLVYVYSFPPDSLRTTYDGWPHFAPLVMHPETGDGVPLSTLVDHYKGG